MDNVLIDSEVKNLRAFVAFVNQKGYTASVVGTSVIMKNITNPDNNFNITRQDAYYSVTTLSVSALDYEYTARCTVYLLMAEYNQSNSRSSHLHLNFKVDL